jgi:hypothetical protein
MRRWLIWFGSVACILVAGAGACVIKSGGGSVPSNRDGGSVVPAGQGVGQTCDTAHACRPGLTCKAGTCAPCQCLASGGACTINDECPAGSYCGASRTCASGGMGVDGSSCQSDADCAAGLRCNLVGFGAQCKAQGKTDVGGACTTGADCLGGLGCINGMCEPFPPSPTGVAPIGLPNWPGEVCRDDTGPTQAYFRVPRGSGDGDFYRLPFPNDVRKNGGKISLAGHPTPGSSLLGFDVIDRWLRDIEASADGFSTSPTVLFRFSAAVDLGGTLKQSGVVRWMDVTAPQKAQDIGLAWVGTTDRNAYICNNWIGIRPQRGQPLAAGHTYAVVLTTTALDASMKPIQVSPDLTALLAASAPSDAVLAAEWPKYKPLRDWAATASVPVSSILNATVFTVGSPAAIAPKLAAAVNAAPAPAATNWVRCGDAPSPCPQAMDTRACGMPDPAFDELHALVTLPIFQQGTAPYATPADRGDFALAADGTPQVQRTEAVCMALTVPKGVAMPAGGWPLVVYAHGTGGSFRSQVPEGVAKRLASIDDGAGGQVHVAVLGIDQVEHGPRRGSSTDTPENLFFNFSNPLAARGNPLQGAADQMSLVRFASALDLPAAQSPTGARIKAGPIAFWGHSQGSTEGGIAMPYTTGVVGAVFSGQGASLIDGLLGKKKPVDIADVLPVVLEESPGKVGGFHPVLALLQNGLDGEDPLNHGSLFAAPLATANQKHVFQPYGQGDTYAPPVTEQTFAIVAQLGEAAPPSGVTSDPIAGGAPLPVPAGGNAMANGSAMTLIVRQYAPGSYDGHFVAFQNATASADVDHFLADVLSGKVPLVGR